MMIPNETMRQVEAEHTARFCALDAAWQSKYSALESRLAEADQPGGMSFRFRLLMAELDRRFPMPIEQAIRSDRLPEAFYLAAIDEAELRTAHQGYRND